eukprot:m.117167 g.117167  ORF g.117167 m.117167 type:complete len:244 (+) comp51966_c1_seq1:634-1365(+)
MLAAFFLLASFRFSCLCGVVWCCVSAARLRHPHHKKAQHQSKPRQPGPRASRPISSSTRKSGMASADDALLDMIFGAPATATVLIPPKPQPQPQEQLTEEESTLRREEARGVQLAEGGDPAGALQVFTAVIARNPDRGSGYNNRAQVLQILGRTADALADVEHALSLSLPPPVRRQALVQRALIHKFQGDTEGAAADMAEAAELGSVFAKQQCVAANPYAAMCNAVVAELLLPYSQGKTNAPQ